MTCLWCKRHSKPASSVTSPILSFPPKSLSRPSVPSAAFLVAHKAFLSSSHQVQLTVRSFSCQHHDSKSPSLPYSRSTVGRQSTDCRPTVVLATDCRSTVGDKMSADCRLTHRPTVDRLSVDYRPQAGKQRFKHILESSPPIPFAPPPPPHPPQSPSNSVKDTCTVFWTSKIEILRCLETNREGGGGGGGWIWQNFVHMFLHSWRKKPQGHFSTLKE